MLASKIFNYRPIRLFIVIIVTSAAAAGHNASLIHLSPVISNRSYQSLITNHQSDSDGSAIAH